MNLRYSYRSIDHYGKVTEGQISAPSRRTAIQELGKTGGTVFELNLIQESSLTAASDSKRPNKQDIITALFEVSAMLNSGVKAGEAIKSQTASSSNAYLRTAFGRAGKTLRHGGSFEQAMQAANLELPHYFYQLVRSGELTGRLGESIKDACEQMEYDLSIQTERRNALIYPSILVVAGILAVLMMFIYVVPSFTNLLEHADKLPWLAWAVLSAGAWTNENLHVVGAVVILVVIAFIGATKSSKLKIATMGYLESVPILGAWIKQSDIACWATVLASLLRNRVDLMTALDLAAGSVKIPSRRYRLDKARKAVKGGASLSEALEENQCLTATGYNLIKVGEKSGNLDIMLASLAKLYTEQTKQRMKKVLLMIEPIAILLIGLVMGTIIIAIILAITSANDIPI